MTGKGATGDPEELLAELRQLVGRLDPVPEEATAFAQAALGWRRIDAELAELLTDSALESDLTALTRSGRGQARSVTFRATDLEIAVEIRDTERGLVLLGQIAPATQAEVDVQRDDSSVAAGVRSDDLGRFRIELAKGGRVRLRIRREPPQPVVETSWIGV